ncbi:MAG: DUF1273 family protein [Clostridia bacterium]|nr:DUF1273 family protein [Clostridia bacterium]
MADFDLKTTVSFTGHRVLRNDFNVDNLKEVINNLLIKGFRTFLVGMAMGFDLKCADVLLEKKKEFNIDVIACIPCKNQDKFFKNEEKDRYQEYLKKVDKIVCFSDEYTNGCMQIRNRYMVDNSSVLVAYLKYFKGGALYTVNYAKKQNKEIIYID